jgi:topoisomerase-4 subunit B
MTRAFNEYARKVALLKEKDKNLEGTDIREGLSAIISVRIPEELLQFEGQTKGKLGTSEARSAVDAIVSEQLAYFLKKTGKRQHCLSKKRLKRARREKRQKSKRRSKKRQEKKKIRSDALRKADACGFKKPGKK